MSGDVHAGFCEGRGVRLPPATHLVILCPTAERADAALAALIAILSDLGLELSQAKSRVVDLRQPGEGCDFLGFHHRWVESTARKGRWFCARWPSDQAVRKARDAIRARTARRWLMLPVAEIVARLNRYLTGWLAYFCWGNSAQVLHDLDYFAEQRLARFIAKKHRRRGVRYGQWVLYNNSNLGLKHLTGNVRYVTA